MEQSKPSVAPSRRWPSGRTLTLALVGALLLPAMAFAQQSWFPWANPEPRPTPRAPVYREQPPPAPAPNSAYARDQGSNQGLSPRERLCLRLEQDLVRETSRGSQTQQQLPKIEQDMRAAESKLRNAQSQLERADCYDFFLFSKTLRRSRRCIGLANAADEAQRDLANLQSQRQQVLGSRDRSHQDEIIRELARNNCGQSYQQEARRRQSTFNPFSSFWQDEDTGDRRGGIGNNYSSLPFATYRTLCVRMCDGYYFPVSFATLPNHFARDEEVCQSKCAAPVELFYHQNPGGSVEQMVSSKTRQPYSGLKIAFRYRKELVQGCSCKQAEYNPDVVDKRAALPTGTLPAAGTLPQFGGFRTETSPVGRQQR